jgi:hypothetical protein
MPSRTVGDVSGAAVVSKSSSRKDSDWTTSLWTSGSDVIAASTAEDVSGALTAAGPPPVSTTVGFVPPCTTIRSRDAGVPHQRGLGTRTAVVVPETDWSS